MSGEPTAVGIAGFVAVLIAIFATIFERRRNKRRDLERVGFMPWPFITMMSLLMATIFIGLTFKGY